jgi:hypothetical protein
MLEIQELAAGEYLEANDSAFVILKGRVTHIVGSRILTELVCG